jgi:hypothetical protein
LLALNAGTDAVAHPISTTTKISGGQAAFGKGGNPALHHAIIHTGFVVVGIDPSAHSHAALTADLFFG